MPQTPSYSPSSTLYAGIAGTTSVPYEMVKDSKIYFNGQNVNSNMRNVLISDGTLLHLNTFDGTIGVDFFTHLGPKVIFDFNNMEIRNGE